MGFSQIGAFGAGLTLADMLRGRAGAEGTVTSRPKSVIMICLLEGRRIPTCTISSRMRRPSIAASFGPLRTNVPGVNICELFPLQARMWDKLSVIRSVVAGQSDHRDHETHTGFVQVSLGPAFGSVISSFAASVPGGMPPFVNLRFESSALEPTYLGLEHRAFAPRGDAFSNLSLLPAVPVERLSERRAMLSRFDGVRRQADRTGLLDGIDAFRARAYDMILSGEVRRALDLSREDPARSRTLSRRRKFLLARRLVEAGVGQ